MSDKAARAEDWQNGYERGLEAAAPEWQPIETAPKDGTRVLVVEEGEYHVAWFVDAPGAGWVHAADDYNIVMEPTHWQPLPPYPTS